MGRNQRGSSQTFDKQAHQGKVDLHRKTLKNGGCAPTAEPPQKRHVTPTLGWTCAITIIVVFVIEEGNARRNYPRCMFRFAAFDNVRSIILQNREEQKHEASKETVSFFQYHNNTNA
jgi:hypothetical protein